MLFYGKLKKIIKDFGKKFNFSEYYLITDNKNSKNLQIIDLLKDETIIKENILDGEKIHWIKVNEKNECIIIGSEYL